MASVTSRSKSLGAAGGSPSRASRSLRSSSRSNSRSLIESRPVRATAIQAVTTISAIAPPISAIRPPAPDSEGGLIRNRTTPTTNAATPAALSGALAASLMHTRVRGRTWLVVRVLGARRVGVPGGGLLLARNSGAVLRLVASALAPVVVGNLLGRPLLRKLVRLLALRARDGGVLLLRLPVLARVVDVLLHSLALLLQPLGFALHLFARHAEGVPAGDPGYSAYRRRTS